VIGRTHKLLFRVASRSEFPAEAIPSVFHPSEPCPTGYPPRDAARGPTHAL
jgi:hypothetical protein